MIKHILYHWLLSTTLTEQVAIVLVYKINAMECVIYAVYFNTQDKHYYSIKLYLQVSTMHNPSLHSSAILITKALKSIILVMVISSK